MATAALLDTVRAWLEYRLSIPWFISGLLVLAALAVARGLIREQVSTWVEEHRWGMVGLIVAGIGGLTYWLWDPEVAYLVLLGAAIVAFHGLLFRLVAGAFSLLFRGLRGLLRGAWGLLTRPFRSSPDESES